MKAPFLADDKAHLPRPEQTEIGQRVQFRSIVI